MTSCFTNFLRDVINFMFLCNGLLVYNLLKNRKVLIFDRSIIITREHNARHNFYGSQ